MNQPTAQVPLKWRPPLGLIVALMLTVVLALPLIGVFFFRIYENQLVRQTEAELIAQSAVLAAVVAREAAAIPPTDLPLGPEAPPLPAGTENDPYHPILPTLDLAADDLRPSRPPARPASTPTAPAFQALGVRVMPDLVETQRMTLAGFRLLDPNGVVIAGREEIGQSLADVEEVGEAMRGHFRSVMRLRIPHHEPPPLYSISRGTNVRVFTAMPIIVRGHVAGVLYASRTPSNVFKELYQERHKVSLAVACMLASTLLIGVAFHLTISGPIRELLARTKAIAGGDRGAIRPLRRHGTQELASLTQGLLDMASSLAARSDFVTTFAAHVSHELKSPLTSILGATELLRDEVGSASAIMDDDARRRFLDNIHTDAKRLTAIVNRLRELARAEALPCQGSTTLASVAADLRTAFPVLGMRFSGGMDQPILISGENLQIILGHLADNSARHGAISLEIVAHRQGDVVCLTVSDDGTGVSPNNQARIFDDFFTTRREQGGTGMGLAIVRAMLTAHHGTIALHGGTTGATFVLNLPAGIPGDKPPTRRRLARTGPVRV